jgi:hypothetical protein
MTEKSFSNDSSLSPETSSFSKILFFFFFRQVIGFWQFDAMKQST